MCENCLYKNNCQFIATHDAYKTVKSCTAFRSEQQIKAEVAREIFEEIEKVMYNRPSIPFLGEDIRLCIAELKKKYTEEQL